MTDVYKIIKNRSDKRTAFANLRSSLFYLVILLLVLFSDTVPYDLSQQSIFISVKEIFWYEQLWRRWHGHDLLLHNNEYLILTERLTDIQSTVLLSSSDPALVNVRTDHLHWHDLQLCHFCALTCVIMNSFKRQTKLCGCFRFFSFF